MRDIIVSHFISTPFELPGAKGRLHCKTLVRNINFRTKSTIPPPPNFHNLLNIANKVKQARPSTARHFKEKKAKFHTIATLDKAPPCGPILEETKERSQFARKITLTSHYSDWEVLGNDVEVRWGKLE